jgi:hypothetical protein
METLEALFSTFATRGQLHIPMKNGGQFSDGSSDVGTAFFFLLSV